ncbi:20476_t:CDS:2 [Gigaspora margarita]|uniref:20476_t:CDS:1 n=1 Tax=Gigaspora margarita TaxID=4874 RepID=A0ABN7UWF2_GIGMA|nr:20476_t:CDS:2 [Gigaspora margarita]
MIGEELGNGEILQLRLEDPRVFVDWCENEYKTTLGQPDGFEVVIGLRSGGLPEACKSKKWND